MVGYSTNFWLDWGFSIHVSHKSLRIFYIQSLFSFKRKEEKPEQTGLESTGVESVNTRHHYQMSNTMKFK